MLMFVLIPMVYYTGALQRVFKMKPKNRAIAILFIFMFLIGGTIIVGAGELGILGLKKTEIKNITLVTTKDGVLYVAKYFDKPIFMFEPSKEIGKNITIHQIKSRIDEYNKQISISTKK